MDHTAWAIPQRIIQASQELVQIRTAAGRAEGPGQIGNPTAAGQLEQERRLQDLREQAAEVINRLLAIKHPIHTQAEQTKHRLQQIQVQADRQLLRRAVDLVRHLPHPLILADQVLHRHLILVQVLHLRRAVDLPRRRRVVEADVPGLQDAYKEREHALSWVWQHILLLLFAIDVSRASAIISVFNRSVF